MLAGAHESWCGDAVGSWKLAIPPIYPIGRLNESALAEARALPVLVDYYFTEMVLVAISLPPTNTVTLCEPFGAATT